MSGQETEHMVVAASFWSLTSIALAVFVVATAVIWPPREWATDHDWKRMISITLAVLAVAAYARCIAWVWKLDRLRGMR